MIAPPTVLLVRERRPRLVEASPRELALHVARWKYAALQPTPTPATSSSPRLAPHQLEGVARALDVLRRHRGVLIADDVGLGKTFIAAELIRREKRPERCMVVTPTSLRRHWAPHLRGAAWMSFARLGRGGTAGWPAPDLVVIDEAHWLRNPATRRYAAAASLCENARVVLLTATPVNNSVWDLYWLLRLFAADNAFWRVGVPDLRSRFAGTEGAAPGAAATRAELRPVLAEIMIRRTRDVVTRSSRPLPGRLPLREPPRPVVYARRFDGAARPFEQTAAAIARLRFPLHRLDDRGSGGAELLVLGLLKRLESGLPTARLSLVRYQRLLQRGIDAARAGRILLPSTATTDRIHGEQLFLEELLLPPVPRSMDLAGLERRLAEEKQRLHEAIASIDRTLRTGGDPKLHALVDLLDAVGQEPRIVFTEYRDTARYLAAALPPRHRVALVDGGLALIGNARCSRAGVIRRFAPRANRFAAPPERERVLTLVCTDVLSEGLDLQDAGIVASYDLPWNPVRLLQRLGRVDRLGSPHASVRSYHFVPDALEVWLGLLERLARKSSAAGAVLGGGAGLDPTVLRRLARGDPRLLEELQAPGATGLAEERLRAALHDWSADAGYPGAEERTLVAHIETEGGWSGALISFAAADRVGEVLLACGDEREQPPDPAALLLCALHDDCDAPGADTTSMAADVLARARPAIARHCAEVTAGKPPIARDSPAGRTARRLLETLASAGLAADESLLRRADALLARLRQGFPAATEMRLVAWLRDPPRGAEAMLASLEPIVAGLAEPRTAEPDSTAAVRILAVLLVASSVQPVDASRGPV